METPVEKTSAPLCKVCKNIIQKDSKKCPTCNSFQDYRRYVNISSNILSLLVALITVLSFGIPYCNSMVKEKNSQIEAYIINERKTNDLKIYCVNEGKRPGLVHTARLTFEYVKEKYYLIFKKDRILIENDSIKSPENFHRDLVEIYPGKTMLFTCVVAPSISIRKIANIQEVFNYLEYDEKLLRNIKIELITTSFKGKQELINLSLDPSHAMTVFKNIVQKLDYEHLID